MDFQTPFKASYSMFEYREKSMAKKYKQIQAGQDWSEWETWAGLGMALGLLGFLLYAHIYWTDCYLYC